MTKKIIITTIIILLAGGGVSYFFLFPEEKKTNYETARVEKADLNQTVQETGAVKANQEVELSFGQGGKLNKLWTKVGEKITATQTLAELDYTDLEIQKQEAEAGLKAAQAKLAKLKAGEKEENIEVIEKQEKQAQEEHLAALDNLEETKKSVQNRISQAEENLENLLDDSPETLTSYEQSIQTARDSLETTQENYQQTISKNQELTLSTINHSFAVNNTALDEIDSIINDKDLQNLNVLGVKNYTYLRETRNLYDQSLALIEEAKKSYEKAKEEPKRETLTTALKDSLESLNKTMGALSYCYKTLENSVTATGFTDSTLDSYKTTIDTQITSVNTNINSLENTKHSLEGAYIAYNLNVTSAENNLNQAKASLKDAIRDARNALENAQVDGEKQITAAKNQVKSAQQAWEVAKSKLRQIKASTRQEDIDLARAEAERVRSNIQLLENKIDKSVIKAPFDGQVTQINYEEGEQVPPNSPVIKILNEASHKIEVDISEVDIAKTSLKDNVTITLDAFGEEEKFKGEIHSIDPAETIIQDVVYYEATIYFTESKDKLKKVKPGMTANITIHTDQKKNVLAIPSRAVIKKDGEKMVRILKQGEIEEIKVKTGLRGDSGMTEILGGLKEGQEIITYIE